MRNGKRKSWSPRAASGVSNIISERSRERRHQQRALREISDHAPSNQRNDVPPRLEVKLTPVEQLKPASRQVRRRDAAQGARLRSSVQRFGICRPLLIDAALTIVEGHGLWEAAKELGVAEVPCVVIDHLSANELRLLRIALNRLGELGDWEPEALRIEFEELIELGEDVVLTGFEMAEVDGLLLEEDGAVAEPEPEPALAALGQGPAVSRPGDLWLLGGHRLLQADARDPAAYATLMAGGEMARLVLTDEPYNVPNFGHVTGDARHREFAMAHGEMSNEEFVAFNQAWMSAVMAYLCDGGLMATFIDWRSVEHVLASGRQLGLSLLNVVAWVKSNAGQGSMWRSQHELLPIFKKGEAAHVNNVALGRFGRWRSNVWIHPGASSLGSEARDGLAHHPTTKPVALIADAILDVTNRGDVVLEPFAGSGSTVLAAETTGRICRAIEIDALYCDLTIERWQQLSGGEARLAETGETFAETKARRAQSDGARVSPDDAAPASSDQNGGGDEFV
jgi:DNA modification methylase